MSSRIQFNCGEFRPGQEPIYIEVLEPPTPSILIPSHPDIQLPRFPRWPRDEIIPPVSSPIIPPIRNVINPRGGNGGASGSSSGIPTGTGTGQPSSTGPGTGVGIPTTGGIGTRGPTTGFEARYRCEEVTYYCPEDMSLPVPQRRVVRIKRFCVLCTPVRNESGQFVWPQDCIYITKPDCEVACQDSNGLNSCIGPSIGIGTGEVINQPISANIVLQTNQTNVSNVLQEYGILITNTPTRTNIINIEAYINQSSNRVTASASNGEPTLYNGELNFFGFNPTNQTNLIQNSRYQQIFSSKIPIELAYLLDRQNSITEWSERAIQDLSLQKLAIGLNKDLLNAFQKIHYPGNLNIVLDNFLEMVRKHILTGTLDELDPQYYKELSRRQAEDTKTDYAFTTVQEYRERAALGLISYAGQIVDSSNLGSIQLRQLRRQRRLNEDLLARYPVCPIDNEDNDLYLNNAGICFKPLSANEFVRNGDGDGYYVALDNVEEGCIPFITTNNVSSAYYVPQGVRFNALTLMGEDPATYLRAESNNLSEFDDPDAAEYEPDLEPLYFMLDLSSVSSILTSNPLIDRTHSVFNLSRDQEEINHHTGNNGFAVTRINIDYRDPIYQYARDSSSFALEQNDITFRGFEDGQGIIDRTVLTRGIPFGVVLTPVKGSQFNPFNGRSRLEQFDDTVTRSIRLIPDINRDKTKDRNPLQEMNLLDVSSEAKIGVFEPLDGQNITYRFYASAANLNNNYYSGGVYISSISLPSSTGINYLVREVIDRIIDIHDPEVITWYDVFRRMPMNKFGEYIYDNSEYLMQKLANGFRNDVKIKHVLAKVDETVHPVLEDDDLVIITRQNRKNAKNYKTR